MKKSNLIIVSELNREDVTLDEFKKLVAEGKIHLDRFMADSLEHEDALADLDQQTRAAVEAMEEEFLHPQPDQAKILKAQVAKLTSEIEGLKNGKAQIVTAKKEAEAKAKAAEGKLAEAEAKAKAAEGKLAEAEAKAEAAEGKLAKAEAKAKAAETKLAETEKKFGEIHDAGKAIQQLTAEKEKLSSELAEAQDKISELMKSRSSKSAAVSSVFDDTPDVVEVEDSENGILSRAYVVYDGNPINSEYAKRVLADFDKKFKPNDFELYFFKNINGRVKLTRKTGDNVTDI